MAGYDLSPSDAAEVLGVHVDTLKRWVKAGKVPAFRTGGGWFRFNRADLDAYIAKNTVGEHPTGDAA